MENRHDARRALAAKLDGASDMAEAREKTEELLDSMCDSEDQTRRALRGRLEVLGLD